MPVTDTEFSQAVNPQSFCTGVSLHHPALIQNTGPLIDMSDIRPGTSKWLQWSGAGVGLLGAEQGACRLGHKAGGGETGAACSPPSAFSSRGMLVLPRSRELGCSPVPQRWLCLKAAAGGAEGAGSTPGSWDSCLWE